MKRVVLAMVVLGVLAAGAGAYFLMGERLVIRVSQAEIQAAMDKRFPLSKKHLLVFALTYSNPRVRLESGADRITAGLDAEAGFTLGGGKYSGSADISGGIEYDPATGSFFLIDGRLESLAVQGVPQAFSEAVRETASLLAKDAYPRIKVYTLDPGKFKHAAARLFLRATRIEGGELVLEMGVR